MGFRYRKFNPKGLNLSVSSKGVRVSKTIKMGNLTWNIGKTLGSDTSSSRVTANIGNGIQYIKTKQHGANVSSSEMTTPPVQNDLIKHFDTEGLPTRTSSDIDSTGMFLFLMFASFLFPLLNAWITIPIIDVYFHIKSQVWFQSSIFYINSIPLIAAWLYAIPGYIKGDISIKDYGFSGGGAWVITIGIIMFWVTTYVWIKMLMERFS